MKWKIKFSTYVLPVGLMALMCNACQQQPSLELLSSKTIDFPSGSGLSFRNDTLYLFGDNATSLLLLSTDYKTVGSFTYWKSNKAVIPKDEKPDIESAMIIDTNGQPELIGVGSMSGEKRWAGFTFRFGTDSVRSKQLFQNRTKFSGIEELNIEGSTAWGKNILLGNRGNLSTRKNHLLLWNAKDKVIVKELVLPAGDQLVGLSGLHYVKEQDLLLFTASEEATASAYEDGAIGDSYIGWISRFSDVWKGEKIAPSKLLKLSAFSKTFQRQKIESVCLQEQTGRRYLLHLVADNDNGRSVLFKVALTL